MSEEQKPNSSSSDSNDKRRDRSTAESELDAILAAAASLSDELAEDIGEPDTPAEVDKTTPVADSVEAGMESLDDELTDMQRLLDAASADLGTEPTGLDGLDGQEASPAESESAAPEAVTHEIPAFMEEFTRAEPGEAASIPTLEEPPATGAGDDSGIACTPPLGVVGTGLPRPVIPESLLEDTELAEPPGPDPSATASKPGRLRSMAARLSPMVGLACDKGVRLLETADRPTASVPPGARRLIGWLALATLGTALIVFLLSFF